jgi:hypothetical protein
MRHRCKKESPEVKTPGTSLQQGSFVARHLGMKTTSWHEYGCPNKSSHVGDCHQRRAVVAKKDHNNRDGGDRDNSCSRDRVAPPWWV